MAPSDCTGTRDTAVHAEWPAPRRRPDAQAPGSRVASLCVGPTAAAAPPGCRGHGRRRDMLGGRCCPRGRPSVRRPTRPIARPPRSTPAPPPPLPARVQTPRPGWSGAAARTPARALGAPRDANRRIGPARTRLDRCASEGGTCGPRSRAHASAHATMPRPPSQAAAHGWRRTRAPTCFAITL